MHSYLLSYVKTYFENFNNSLTRIYLIKSDTCRVQIDSR